MRILPFANMVARLCCFLAALATASQAYNRLHMVNLQDVMCPGYAGYFDVDLDMTLIDQYSPHIVTFLRSSNLETTVSYDLYANGVKTSIGQAALRLTGVPSARRLVGSIELPTNAFHQEYKSVDAVNATTAISRKLSGRRRGGGSSSSSSSSSSRSSYSSTSSKTTSSSSSSSPRRRSQNTASAAYRRRGAPTSSGTGPRRRSYSTVAPGAPASHNRFQTASGSGYGYGSPASMQGNYGGSYPAASPSYGYAGASSYRPGSTATIVAGGFLVGAGSYYMLSQMSSRGDSCTGASCCNGCSSMSCPYGCCESYRRRRGSGQAWCDYGMNRQYYRDDVLQDGQGFYPSDFQSPLKVRVSAVSGSGYVDICPPPNWNENQTPPNNINSALFVTLTPMTELADTDESDEPMCLNDQNRVVQASDCPGSCCVGDKCGDSQTCTMGAIIGTIAGIASCICCYGGVGLVFYFCCYKRQQEHHMAMSQPVGGYTGQPQYNQAYGQPAYAHGQPVQQPHGSPPVVMGTVVAK
eukprot:TRINITY_DN17566_c0_g1_i1.p1 TRINITY_DN17566_c0_g1~~TRINITY_DN17566_c0_g1_i1.p1  ORF type:complete len:524 (+),score=36.13 TRINITY_DN17566_c0_g1_i1:25-1596(+)